MPVRQTRPFRWIPREMERDLLIYMPRRKTHMRTTIEPATTQIQNRPPRRPRAHWVSVLEKLIAPLNADPTKVYEWKKRDAYLRHDNHGRFGVIALYAFGSFARGAADSSDLDLIVLVAPHSVFDQHLKCNLAETPDRITLKKVIWGQPRQVDFVVESVDDHRRRNQFPEHRLVWSREQPDLQRNLTAIPVVADAGRYERKADRLPFPITLFDTWNVSPEGVMPGEGMVEAIDRGDLVSTFIPLESIDVSAELTKEQREALWRLNNERPSVAPTMHYLFGSTEAPYVQGVYETTSHPATSLLVNGRLATFRRPWLSAAPLDIANVTRILFVPDVPKSLTPGIWQLARGPHHAVVKAFEDVKLWFLAAAGRPVLVTRKHHDRPHFDGRVARHVAIHAFGTRQEAEDVAAEWKKDSRIDVGVVALSGPAVLEWLGRVGALFVNGVEIETSQQARTLLAAVRAAMTNATQYAPPKRGEYQGTSTTTSKGVYCVSGGGFITRGRARNAVSGRIIELVMVLPEETRAAQAGATLRRHLRLIEQGHV